MAFFWSSPAAQTKPGSTIYFEGDDYCCLTEGVVEVVQRLNGSDTDIVLFGDIAVNRRKVLYVESDL